jgi:hypothetical protein
MTTIDCPDRSINFEALGTLMMILRVLSNFLCAHNYPAFKNMDHPGSEPDILEETRGTKRSNETTASSSGKRRQREDGEVEEDSRDEMAIDTEPVISSTTSAISTLRFAQPPAVFVGWGDEDDVPNCDGVFVPFIQELAQPDKKTIPALFEAYFLKALGSNTTDIARAMNNIRSAASLMSLTTMGMSLAHLARCIQVGLQCQAQCFAVVDSGDYLGCAILGSRFTIVVEGRDVVPISHSLLLTRIKSFGGHTMSIRSIYRCCGMTDAEMDDDNFVFPSSMMELRRELLKKSLNEETRDEIIKLASGLRFSGSWSFNANAISSALRVLGSSDDINERDDLPIYFTELFCKDPIRLVMSCFGRFAPSCLFPSTPSIDLKKSLRPAHFVWQQRELTEASMDMKKILSTKTVSNTPTTRRSVGYQNMVFKGQQCRELFSAVTEFALGVDYTPFSDDTVTTGAGPSEHVTDLYEL